jgi:hypothetical protein
VNKPEILFAGTGSTRRAIKKPTFMRHTCHTVQ